MNDDSSDMPPDDEEKVGYKRPPKAHRFRKGRSGNPRGRRKGSKSFETLVREELAKKVQVKTDGKVKSLSVAQALLMRTLREGISGSRRAADQGIRLMERYGLFDDSQEESYDLKLLTDEELKQFGRLLYKAAGKEDEYKEDVASISAKAEEERIRIFGPGASISDIDDDIAQ